MTTTKQVAPWLWVLFSLFLFRVSAQLLQTFFSMPFLPPFEYWHSGFLAYEILLSCQVALLIIMARMAYRFSTQSIPVNRKLGFIWMVIGYLYMAIMLLRFGVGLTHLSDHVWFTRFLPTFFHFVLAAFIILIANYHLRAKII